ncbi:hypothetical protein [Deinococcus multiflagellatus]|uniref:Uncharacterized protein n=1 Tax=Deinococcus multiflagellatus TaxID=1656887 RepID=A0ABW1ZSV3_9DEIO|nr:hypothetical protein [Deinococcus multiflagellatus]MBZ9715888.1 hypothetical protein [Deinococcus multiflagellatus]
MRRVALLLTLLAAGPLAGAQANDPVTLPSGVVVKEVLPGYLRGNGGSYEGHDNKVLVCHATSAVDNNAYVVVSISQAALDAHLAHEHQNGNGQRQHRDAIYLNGLTCGYKPS